MDGRGSIRGRGKIFLFSITSRSALGPTQSPIRWVLGAISPRVKRLRREADHSPPSSAEVKKGGAIPPLPHMSSWHSDSLINHRDNFISGFTYLSNGRVKEAYATLEQTTIYTLALASYITNSSRMWYFTFTRYYVKVTGRKRLWEAEPSLGPVKG
jgi:hypothetical protein